MAATPIGQAATIQVLRDGKPLTLTAQVAELPEPQQQSEATPPARGQLGLSVQDLSPALAKELGVPDTAGVVVASVEGGSPAADAGVQPGDVIVAANRQPVKTVTDLRQLLAARKAGEPTLLQIHRTDASLFIAVPERG